MAISPEQLEHTTKVLSNVNEYKERESASASLLFVRSGKMSAREILEMQPVTVDFADFCKSLGWVIIFCLIVLVRG